MKYLWMSIASLVAFFCWGSSMFLTLHDGSPSMALGLFILAELIFSVVCGYVLGWLVFKIFD